MGVPKGVVMPLEVIDIDHHQADRVSESLRAVELFGERLLKVTVSVQARQAVDVCNLGVDRNLLQIDRMLDE